jgi:hypothetical protein
VALHQGFATGEMGFNDKFALQKILNCLHRGGVHRTSATRLLSQLQA